MKKIAIIGGQSGKILNQTCKSKGLYTLLFCGNKKERGFGEGDENYAIDLKNTDEIVSIVKNNADLLLLGTGHELAHKIARKLYDLGFPTSVNPYAAEYGKDKTKAFEIIERLGYKCPKRIIIKNKQECEQITNNLLPCVVKSKNDKLKTAKANNMDELLDLVERHLKAKSEMIIEEFISGITCTIPVVSNGRTWTGIETALDMQDINKWAVGPLENFTKEDEICDANRNKVLTLDMKRTITEYAENIAKEMGLLGFVRFDLIVTESGEIYWLEVNEVAVSALGAEEWHFPWETVNISPAEIMVDNLLDTYED